MLNGKNKFAVKIWLCITLLALLFSAHSPGTVAAAPGYQGDDPPPADPPPVVEPQLLAQLDANENIGYIIHFSERPNLDLGKHGLENAAARAFILRIARRFISSFLGR